MFRKNSFYKSAFLTFCCSAFFAVPSFAMKSECVTEDCYCDKCDESSYEIPCVSINYEQPLGTLSDFLQISLSPVGIAYYVWNGGHGRADNAFGTFNKGMNLGDLVNQSIRNWWRFHKDHNENYNPDDEKFDGEKDTRLIPCGLDCSGFVGFVLRSFFSLSHNNEDILNHGVTKNSVWYVPMLSKIGLGNATPAKNLEEIADFKDRYHPGDILCGDLENKNDIKRHVYIVLGVCPDNSLVLVHSSSQGVHVCGTSCLGCDDADQKSKDESGDSMAYRFALNYMKKYASEFINAYPEYEGKKQCWRDSSYLHKYCRFRWNSKVLKDDISEAYGKPVSSAEDVVSLLERSRKIKESSKVVLEAEK